MSDVLDIARDRRAALETEISHLDAFIRMGEKLRDQEEKRGGREAELRERLNGVAAPAVAAE